jgi:Ca-activated chloride channel family protein
VRRAAQELAYTEKRATVVLVSDGVETCKADPCRVGEELARTGVGFTAHVIGFGVTAAEQTGLRCLAKNTGGIFLAASDAASLRAALGKTVEQVRKPAAKVVEQPGPAALQAPATVVAGSRFEVRWQGPGSARDYVTVVPAGASDDQYLDYAYAADGSPSALTAPDAPGAYEVRYVFDATRAVLARVPLRVAAAEASLSGPATVQAGGRIEVHWTGPNNARDYLTIVAAGAGEGAYLNYAYTTDGSPLSFQAPETPGAYELRYVTGQDAKTLARQPISIVAATASVSAPSSVGPGERLSVRWEGPNNPGDYVTIVRAGADEGAYLDYAYTRDGSPASIQAPQERGAYEVRYVTGQSNKTLARAPVTVR